MIKIMERMGETVKNHPKMVVGVILLITVLNIYPLTNLETETNMSIFAPDHEVTKAKDTVDRDFSDPIQRVFTIVVAKEGNILSRECLLEILKIENNIRTDRDVQKYLIKDPNNVTSIADAIEQMLFFAFDTTLKNASGSQLDMAINQTLRNPELKAMLSKDLTTGQSKNGAKAAIIVTQLNNTLLGPENEEGQLAVKEAVLGTDTPNIEVGVLAGVEAEMEETMMDGMKLLPICFILIVIVLYLSLRRISDVLLSILGIPIIFIWMFGISSAFGFKMTMLSSFAPILILAMGIDYAIHSLHRYREEREKDAAPKEAVGSGITHVGGAIFLATVTTVAAFFSNILSSIPATREFGLTVGIGIFSAFVIMGIFIPTLRYMFDERVSRRREEKNKDIRKGTKKERSSREKKKHPLSHLIVKITAKPLPVILMIIVITAASLFGAFRIGTGMSPKDFMAEDSHVLSAMNLMEEHFPQRGTMMPGEILVEGEVSDPEVLDALERTVENMKDDKHVSNISGRLQVTYICPYVTDVMQNSSLRQELELEDVNNDSIPDSKEDAVKIYDLLYENGTENATTTDVRHVLHRDRNGNYDKTVIWVDIVKYIGHEEKKEIKDELERDSLPLESLENGGKIKCVVTGEIINIFITEKAMTDSMLSSIVICFIICFIVLTLVFRSFRFGAVTMIPVCLVVAWILGTMFVLSYDLNIITILIGAMSIGVGVDYSIHITHRYREERGNGKRPEKAIEKALSSTGMALFGAAATTTLGFAVLVFSSMGVFVTFGLLTALMVVYSFLAAIIILPMLLMLVDRKKSA